jgi:hypothetical protein
MESHLLEGPHEQGSRESGWSVAGGLPLSFAQSPAPPGAFGMDTGTLALSVGAGSGR